MDLICPRCGAKSGERKFVENFCIDCFKGYIDLDPPAAVEIPVCRKCDRVKLSGWQEKDAKELGNYILKQCKVEYDTAKAKVSDDGDCDISFVIKAEDSLIEVSEHVGIKYTQTMCERCSRASSSYFEAILQLRGSSEDVERMRKKIEPELERDTFISKTVELKKGVDFYVGSKQVASSVISRFGLKPKISNKLHGVQDGQRVYRTTFSVRL